MPRTKISRQAAAASKRNRISATHEARLAALQELEKLHQNALEEQETILDKNLNLIKDTVLRYVQTLPSQIKDLTLGDCEKIGMDPLGTDFTNNMSLASAITNNTLAGSCSIMSKNKKKSSRSDDGYVTEENAPPLVINGPLSSAKARPRRSRSAQTSSSSIRSNTISRPLVKSGSMSHASRSTYRTPAQKRLQTQSVDRMLKTITPKCQANTPVAMLRYPKHGETVVSLSGSPVIVQGVINGNANINIPISDGIFSIQPSAITNADADLVSRIDPAVLQQLRQLQTNLNMIMSQAMK